MTDLDSTDGRGLDALVAERILGWQIDPMRTADDGSPLVLKELPRFCANPPSARGIRLVFEQRHPGVTMRTESRSPYRVVVRGPSGREYVGLDESEGIAICRAMLKAMDGEGPGLPDDQMRRQQGSTGAIIGAELLGAHTQPHQSVGLSAHAVVLQQGGHKEGAARALLECAATMPHIVPYVAEQSAAGAPNVAEICVETLSFLAKAGEAARAALPAATKHPNANVSKAAREALD
ncbi:MAG: hypothetical protein AAF628_35250 [Planctomycetota bacterium]